MKKIYNLAEIYYVHALPHSAIGPVAFTASMHVDASVPNFLALEFHRYGDPTWNDTLLSDEPVIQHGHVVLCEKPGLGVELNEEFLAANSEGAEPLWQ